MRNKIRARIFSDGNVEIQSAGKNSSCRLLSLFNPPSLCRISRSTSLPRSSSHIPLFLSLPLFPSISLLSLPSSYLWVSPANTNNEYEVGHEDTEDEVHVDGVGVGLGASQAAESNE